jgi:hypothetical protein
MPERVYICGSSSKGSTTHARNNRKKSQEIACFGKQETQITLVAATKVQQGKVNHEKNVQVAQNFNLKKNIAKQCFICLKGLFHLFFILRAN